MSTRDPHAAMVARFEHAADVCRVCASFRRVVPDLPDTAERAAVVLSMPIPQLVDRLNNYVREEKRHGR